MTWRSDWKSFAGWLEPERSPQPRQPEQWTLDRLSLRAALYDLPWRTPPEKLPEQTAAYSSGLLGPDGKAIVHEIESV